MAGIKPSARIKMENCFLNNHLHKCPQRNPVQRRRFGMEHFRFDKRYAAHTVKRFLVMRKLFLVCAALFVCTLLSAYTESPVQKVLSFAECEMLVEQYYRMQPIDPQPLLGSFDRIREMLKTSFDAERFDLYLEHAKLISMLYVYEGNRQCKKYDKLVQEEAPEFLKQAEKLTGIEKEQRSALYMRYADYLYTKIALPESTFKIVSTLPVLYRKALMLDPDNIGAAVKLACWHIYPADASTVNYNSYIEAQEEYIETLSAADQFNAYLLYSAYYMRKYDSDTGRAYLQKAAALFPGHTLLLHVYENYKKGNFNL